MAACRATASLLDRAGIQLVFGIKHVHLAVVGIYVTMAAVTARIYAVKEIDSSLYALQDIRRCSDTHEVGWFVLRKIRYDFIKDTVHFFMCLTNCQSADRIAVKLHLGDFFCMFDTDIFVNSSLVDAKQKLFFIDGIRQAVQTCHLCLTSCQPACGTLYRFLYIVSVCHTARTFIKRHGDRGSQIGLDLHALLRSHKDLVSVNM